jgi:predicted nucleic acid-binding protein
LDRRGDGYGLARSGARSRFAAAVELIRSSPRADLVHISQALFDRALELYDRRFDKTWGLVDCASFLVMEDQGISQAITNDRHFEQAGFKSLLPASSPT